MKRMKQTKTARGKRRSRRQARKRSPRLKLSGIQWPWKPIAIGLGIVLVVTWWVRYDPAFWFRLGKINVAGPTEHLSIDEIEELAAPTLGIPLMAIDLNPIRERIEEHPWVSRAGLRRLLPETLFIHVSEHVPAALLIMNKNYLVSTDGTLIKSVEPKDPKNFPVITGLQHVRDNQFLQRRVLESLAVIHKLKETGAIEPFGLSEVHWEKERHLSLITEHRPFEIVLGEGPWKEKLERLIHVLPYVQSEGRIPTRVALDQSDGVVVRYANAKEKKL